LSPQAETWRKSMIKILAAIGLGSALMLAPAVAFADDAAPAAPAADAKMAPKPKAHHHVVHHVVHHVHHVVHHKAMKKPAAKPADAPDAAPKS
jgi:hypothetical protein